MTLIPFLVKDGFKSSKVSTQVGSCGSSPVNHALVVVTQEVARLLQRAEVQLDASNSAEMVSIRAIEPEYRQAISVELLTERELEVLRLIVEGHSNLAISQRLYIAQGTVKTHVRNILRKLCVNDRTQAAIRALRCGLVR